jgi:hypothetical protein
MTGDFTRFKQADRVMKWDGGQILSQLKAEGGFLDGMVSFLGKKQIAKKNEL